MGNKRGNTVLVGKPQVNISVGRHKHRWEENIKVFVQECEDKVKIHRRTGHKGPEGE
jgi:hypothetical protein